MLATRIDHRHQNGVQSQFIVQVETANQDLCSVAGGEICDGVLG